MIVSVLIPKLCWYECRTCYTTLMTVEFSVSLSPPAERRLPGRPAAGLRPSPGWCGRGGWSRGPGPGGGGVRGVQRRHAERGRLLGGAGPWRETGGAPAGLPGPRHPERQPCDGHH